MRVSLIIAALAVTLSACDAGSDRDEIAEGLRQARKMREAAQAEAVRPLKAVCGDAYVMAIHAARKKLYTDMPATETFIDAVGDEEWRFSNPTIEELDEATRRINAIQARVNSSDDACMKVSYEVALDRVRDELGRERGRVEYEIEIRAMQERANAVAER